MTAKFGEGAPYSRAGSKPWADSVDATRIRRHDQRAVDATIAFCDYTMRTYGRFPAHVDAFKTVVAFQAHHVDPTFYDHFYPQPSLPVGASRPPAPLASLRCNRSIRRLQKGAPMTNRRRVVITGMGVVSPLGFDLRTFWHLLSQGRSGISPITSFDTSPFNASLAGEVTDFDPTDFIQPKKARRHGSRARNSQSPRRSWRGATPPSTWNRKIVTESRVCFGTSVGGLEGGLRSA